MKFNGIFIVISKEFRPALTLERLRLLSMIFRLRSPRSAAMLRRMEGARLSPFPRMWPRMRRGATLR